MEGISSGYQLFQDSLTLEWIERLAKSRSLALVAGAGVSVESGLPDWGTLVERLLVACADRRGLGDTAAEQFAGWTLQREDLTGAGEIARQLLGGSFREVLHADLYDGREEFAPGETAQALAKLRADRPSSRCVLITTNYDTLLENALRFELQQRDYEFAVRSISSQQQVPDGVMAVHHLHGVLTPGNKAIGTLVLSDRDYHLMQDPKAWQESFFSERLNENTCLFVGTSLTDPNLLRYIYRSGTRKQHVALFVRQQDAALYDSRSERVRLLREWSQGRKWATVGVKPLLVDYYSQAAQFLWEVLARSHQGEAYRPLPERLLDWWEGRSQALLSTDLDVFGDFQEMLHEIVKDSLRLSERLIRSNSGVARKQGEKLGLSLWVYNPKAHGLINWASADRVWRDPDTLSPVPVEWSSDFIAMQAFCSGSLVSQSTSRYAATRWNHVIGFPIYVHAGSGRLPVGAATLASTESRDHSLLNRGVETVRLQVIPALARTFEEVLEPVEEDVIAV